jgi:hypothetical protein
MEISTKSSNGVVQWCVKTLESMKAIVIKAIVMMKWRNYYYLEHLKRIMEQIQLCK